MSWKHNGRMLECVAVDLNTQLDFCTQQGARPVLQLDQLVPALRRVVAWTKRNYVPVISSLGSHRAHEFASGLTSPCCVDGSYGQGKVDFTLLYQRTFVEVDNTLSVPLNLFDLYQQIIFRERTNDLFANPKADRFLTQVRTKEFVVFGTALETSVKAVVLGLLSRNKPVALLADACGYWDAAGADLAIRQMKTKGASVISVDQLLTRRLSRHYRYLASSRRRACNNGRLNGNGLIRRDKLAHVTLRPDSTLSRSNRRSIHEGS